MNTVHAIILTAPRPHNAFYLGDALLSLGIKDITIMNDHTNQGNVVWFKKCLEHMLTEHPGKDMLYFQDDIIACFGAGQVMLETPVPDTCAFVTWYDSRRFNKIPFDGTTLNIVPFDGTFWCPLATRFRADVIPFLNSQWPVKNGRVLKHGLFNPTGKRNADDEIIGRICERHLTASRYAIALPNLVQHVGIISGCELGRTLEGRQSVTYVGHDYDATGTAYDVVTWGKSSAGILCPHEMTLGRTPKQLTGQKK